MKKLALALTSLALLSSCIDRGRCLESHVVHHPETFWIEFQHIGTVNMPVTHVIPAHDETVCDRWEFPNGRPKER
jgi:hypothetical protein